MQPAERPLCFLPPETPAVSAIVVAAALVNPAPAAASPDELVPVPAETNAQGLFEASQCSLQSDLPMEKHSIFCLPADERLSREPNFLVCQPSIKNCSSLS